MPGGIALEENEVTPFGNRCFRKTENINYGREMFMNCANEYRGNGFSWFISQRWI